MYSSSLTSIYWCVNPSTMQLIMYNCWIIIMVLLTFRSTKLTTTTTTSSSSSSSSSNNNNNNNNIIITTITTTTTTTIAYPFLMSCCFFTIYTKKKIVCLISSLRKFSTAHIIVVYICLRIAQQKLCISSKKHTVKCSVQDNSMLSLWTWKIRLHEIWSSHDGDVSCDTM